MRILMTLLLPAMLLTFSPHTCKQARAAARRSKAPSGARGEIPTVDFCELVKHPRLYFDKTVRLTAMLDIAEAAAYLSDARCVLRYDDQVGIRYVNAYERRPEILGKYEHPRVTVVGVLRDSSLRGFASYRYRFDIERFEDVREDISGAVINYGGTLRAGMTYRATVRGDGDYGLTLSPPLRMLEHQAVLVEWTNLREFPALVRMRRGSRERRIVLFVVSDETVRVTEWRWDRTVRCKIIIVE
jgi:hypothetical protein